MNSKEIAKLITDEVIKGLKSNPGKWIKSWTVDRPRNRFQVDIIQEVTGCG